MKTRMCPLCGKRMRRIYTQEPYSKGKQYWYPLGWLCRECHYVMNDRYEKELGLYHMISPYNLISNLKTTKEILDDIFEKIRNI
ncbi:hypothetical protein ES702_06956 [subsurface metagenome]